MNFVEAIAQLLWRKHRAAQALYVGKVVWLHQPNEDEEKVIIESVDDYGFVFKSVSSGERKFVSHSLAQFTFDLLTPSEE